MTTLSNHPALLAARDIASTRVSKLAPPPAVMALLSRRDIAAFGPTPIPNREKELRRFLRRLDASTSRWGRH